VKFAYWWIALIFVISGPWYGLLRSPQWARVTWVPFTGSEDKLRDMLVNAAMFVPLGWTFKSRHRGVAGTACVVAAAVLVSFAAESMQLYCAKRDPSATDMVMNAVGTLAGAAGASLWRRRPLP
jgi:glycopeptide antibiotics resistance protein